MMQSCWKIRLLREVPQITLSKIQKREVRRQRHLRQELLIIQCIHCRLVLRREYLPESRLRSGGDAQGVKVNELERVRAKTTSQGMVVCCWKCRAKVAGVGEGQIMAVKMQTLMMHIPESIVPHSYTEHKVREPFSTLGAFSGLSYRKILTELYRLAYTKQSHYKLILKQLSERLRGYQAKFKGLYNLIILNDSTQEKPSRIPHNLSSSPNQRLEYDKMMRSTGVELSNSRHLSRQKGSRAKRKPKSPILLPNGL